MVDRCGLSTLRSWVGTLIAGLAVTVPLAAQPPQEPSPSQCKQTETLTEYQKARQANPQSSLTNYCIGELLFKECNWQASANAYRSALDGDGNPDWTMVWSYIQLGKIFDVTDQRRRAMAQYRRAIQTEDNTRGALSEARELLQTPYKLPDGQ
jgi:tetratricopeptide (TPR) repeat protein